MFSAAVNRTSPPANRADAGSALELAAFTCVFRESRESPRDRIALCAVRVMQPTCPVRKDRREPVASFLDSSCAHSCLLQAHCRTKIAGYKVPRVLLLGDAPRTNVGKPDYKRAASVARARLGAAS